MKCSLFSCLVACFLSMVCDLAESESIFALRETFVTDLNDAKTEQDFTRIVENRLSCGEAKVAICEWEISEIMFLWLTKHDVQKNIKYGPRFMFEHVKSSINSGAAGVMGTALSSIYGFGLFGVPKDQELAICWTKIDITTSEKSNVKDCEQLELKKYGRVSPWLYLSG
jgi:hypothetical protein